MFCQPFLKHFGMVPASIVHNNDHPASLAAMAQELLEKPLERFGIEFLSYQLCHQASIMAGNRTKDGNSLARGCMEHDGVALLGRHPHQATGAMLLEMAFIFKPEVNRWILGHAMEFFYMPAVLLGQHGQLPDGVFFSETPIE